jgi:hypothetical protein
MHAREASRNAALARTSWIFWLACTTSGSCSPAASTPSGASARFAPLGLRDAGLTWPIETSTTPLALELLAAGGVLGGAWPT